MIVAEPAADEKVVLVHEVSALRCFLTVSDLTAIQITSKDSLAGVSLKYGIRYEFTMASWLVFH
jgi:hypothetical protein